MFLMGLPRGGASRHRSRVATLRHSLFSRSFILEIASSDARDSDSRAPEGAAGWLRIASPEKG